MASPSIYLVRAQTPLLTIIVFCERRKRNSLGHLALPIVPSPSPPSVSVGHMEISRRAKPCAARRSTSTVPRSTSNGRSTRQISSRRDARICSVDIYRALFSEWHVVSGPEQGNTTRNRFDILVQYRLVACFRLEPSRCQVYRAAFLSLGIDLSSAISHLYQLGGALSDHGAHRTADGEGCIAHHLHPLFGQLALDPVTIEEPDVPSHDHYRGLS